MIKKFHLDPNQSPTHANLSRFLKEEGWLASCSVADTLFNETWLDFSPLISQTLEYKHLLAAFLQSTHLTHLIPDTFFIDDSNWPLVLETIEKSFSNNTPWILKPSMLNNGQHIHIFNNIDAIAVHFLSSQRMGGPQVLQRYINKPQLIQGPLDGHKFSIRQLVVLSTHAGSALFPNGYLNIALKPYQNGNYDQVSAHLTNEHLTDTRINVVQRLSNEMTIYHPYKQEIIILCKQVVTAIKKHFFFSLQDKPPQIGCFGFDFMVEEGGKIWLLEVNHGPCFPIEEDHPLFNILYKPFWENTIKHFVDRKPSDFIMLEEL